MTAARRCPHCGAGLSDDVAASAACPVCLFKLALEPASESGGGSEDAWTGVPPWEDAGAHPLRIGPYRILTVLGQGGMGVVYLAEQAHPIRRKVALKVVKVGMDTREVVARFDTERQALALMSHPNIARVLDAGASEEGRPYFVMDYVPGIPITDYCDRNRLATRERLALAAGLAVSTWLYFQVRAKREASDHQSYLANIAAAESYVRATEGNEARRRLLAAPAAQRNWEWRYLSATSTPVAATLPGGHLLAVSGRSVFIARESRLEERDRVTFERTASHALPGEGVAADPKGRRVLVRSTTGKDPSHAVVDVATGQTLSHPLLGVSLLDIRTTKGRRLEGTGVLPDKAVPVSLNDLRSKRDAALAEAIEILKAAAKTAPPAAQQSDRPVKTS